MNELPVTPIQHTLTDEAWRDWYAGQALNGCLAGRAPGEALADDKILALASFDVADAMMAERAIRRMK